MSATKIGEAATKEEVVVAVFTTAESKQEKKQEKKAASDKARGPNMTPKSDMHIGRDWNHIQWAQAFKAYKNKLDRLNYKRSEAK